MRRRSTSFASKDNAGKRSAVEARFSDPPARPQGCGTVVARTAQNQPVLDGTSRNGKLFRAMISQPFPSPAGSVGIVAFRFDSRWRYHGESVVQIWSMHCTRRHAAYGPELHNLAEKPQFVTRRHAAEAGFDSRPSHENRPYFADFFMRCTRHGGQLVATPCHDGRDPPPIRFAISRARLLQCTEGWRVVRAPARWGWVHHASSEPA
jgi:hypothetical protein